MNSNSGPATTTLRGIPPTEFRYGPPSYGTSPWDDSVETPIILTLTESLVVLPNPPTGQEGDLYAHGIEVIEVQVAVLGPVYYYVDWEKLAGAMIEITGRLFPQHTGHHYRQVFIDFDPAAVRFMSPFSYEETPSARIFSTSPGALLNY